MFHTKLNRFISWILLAALLTGCGDDSKPGSTEESKSGHLQKHPKKPAPLPRLPLEKDPVVTLTDEEIGNGWIQLFDGQTLAGWHASNDVNWQVNENGEIEASKGETGLLLTNVPFENYELRCDFWAGENCNSGIFLRTVEDPKDPTADCYELNICDTHEKFKTASLVGRAQPAQEVTGEKVWKTFHVVVDGSSVKVNVDGELVMEYKDDSDKRLTSGFIGLQKNEGLVRFRNIYLQPLGAEPLFNTLDLEGWREVPGNKAKFEVQDDTIHATGGLGFLETENEYDNFILQFDAKTNVKDVNSGIFFRLNPGTEKNPSDGYELQIDNSIEGDDRTKPKNAGTGAIFRRNEVRWVNSEDSKWLSATLIAHDSRMAVWVNGLLVTDWVDDRAPHGNPRRGLKLKAGPISLQAHDEGTDVSFRNLRVTEYAHE